MASDQSLNLDQRITTRLTAQQLRFVKLLEYSEPELEEAVQRELEDNPALDVEEKIAPTVEENGYFPRSINRSPDDVAANEIPQPDMNETLYDSLISQLSERELTPDIEEAARFIIGSLDSNGYLRRPLASLVNDMAFGPGIEVTLNQAQQALDVVKSLDPPGVGAESLQQCLELELERMSQSQQRDDALTIIRDEFESFTKKHTDRIVRHLNISEERVHGAINLIRTLNPKPGASINSDPATMAPITPDIIISNEEGQFVLSTNSRIPELMVDTTFSQAMAEIEASGKRNRKGFEFIVTRYNDAREFIRILRQRKDTLMAVMAAIMKIQHDYFATEDIYRLKPMMMKDIAAITGLDISVISRASSNKYVQTPWGIFPLRFFFSDSIGESQSAEADSDSADALTNRKIEAEIERIVDEEDKKHPLSDEKIRQIMADNGFEVSRRTVAKYRDRKGIPVARLRREL